MDWNAIAVIDPDLLFEVTGDRFNLGDLYSIGTVVADNTQLAQRGLEAIVLGEQPDFTTHSWDADKKVLVPLSDIALVARIDTQIAELQTQIDDLMVQKEAMVSEVGGDDISPGPAPVVIEVP